MSDMEWIEGGGLTSPDGFRAGAVACGLKASGNLDLALLAADGPCHGAGVFTQSALPAAPVLLDRQVLADGAGDLRGVIINAGIANACTGHGGMADAREMQALAARAMGCEPGQVLVLSTGVIGRRLDMARLRQGVPAAAARLSADGGAELARAMMTTDTRPKEAAIRVELPGGSVTIGGAAKGAGMIHPDMATMLAVVTTDARIESLLLDPMLRAAMDQSFNRISIDGDTSTNDSVLLLAGGASGMAVEGRAAVMAFAEALAKLCHRLALAIVRDGEGARRLAAIQVRGARSDAEALAAARTIATSPLVKTALAGGDPNWGRILAAAARSGAALDPARLALAITSGDGDGGAAGDWLELVRDGQAGAYREVDAAAILSGSDIAIRLDMGMAPEEGDGEARVWTCDFTADYVAINADYRT